MPFAYYDRLSSTQKRIYRQSDEISSVGLPEAAVLRPLIGELESVLKEEDRRRTAETSRRLLAGITERLKVPAVRVRVYAARPSRSWGELQGLYELAAGSTPAQVSVWMRTAKRRQVVAFRTFLRTLLHELCHHLDYELFDLADSFHTEGFYKRESSLFHQLVGDDGPGGAEGGESQGLPTGRPS